MKNLRNFNFVDLLDFGSPQIKPDIQFNVINENGTLLGKSDFMCYQFSHKNVNVHNLCSAEGL